MLNSLQSKFITSVIAYVFTVFKFHLRQSKAADTPTSGAVHRAEVIGRIRAGSLDSLGIRGSVVGSK